MVRLAATQSRYVCMFGVLSSGCTSGEAHAGAHPGRAKMEEEPKTDLMAREARRGEEGPPKQGASERFQRLADALEDLETRALYRGLP